MQGRGICGRGAVKINAEFHSNGMVGGKEEGEEEGVISVVGEFTTSNINLSFQAGAELRGGGE